MSTGAAASVLLRSRRAVAQSCDSRSQITSPATMRSIVPLDSTSSAPSTSMSRANPRRSVSPSRHRTAEPPRPARPNCRHSRLIAADCPASSCATTSLTREQLDHERTARSDDPAPFRSTSRASRLERIRGLQHVDADPDDDGVDARPSRPSRTGRRRACATAADESFGRGARSTGLSQLRLLQPPPRRRRA